MLGLPWLKRLRRWLRYVSINFKCMMNYSVNFSILFVFLYLLFYREEAYQQISMFLSNLHVSFARCCAIWKTRVESVWHDTWISSCWLIYVSNNNVTWDTHYVMYMRLCVCLYMCIYMYIYASSYVNYCFLKHPSILMYLYVSTFCSPSVFILF